MNRRLKGGLAHGTHIRLGIPIYVQIADDIRAQILRGALRAGDQLTSTTSTPRPTRINPATVGKAFAILVDEGLVEKRRGIGMFVAEGARDALVATGSHPTWRRP